MKLKHTPSSKPLALCLVLAFGAQLSGCKPTEPESASAVSESAPAAGGAPAPVSLPAAETAGVLVSAPLTVDRTDLTTCNIETINGAHFASEPLPVKAESQFDIGGFLFDAGTKSVPDNLRMRLVSQDQKQAWETAIEGRMDRPGLPEFLKVGDWAFRSGFLQTVQTSGLPPDLYHLEVSFTRDGKRFVCDNGRNVEVTR